MLTLLQLFSKEGGSGPVEAAAGLGLKALGFSAAEVGVASGAAATFISGPPSKSRYGFVIMRGWHGGRKRREKPVSRSSVIVRGVAALAPVVQGISICQ